MRTVFVVPRLNTASVAAGACCPVPAEALIEPELEANPGVEEAGADWQTALVWVRHAPEVTPELLAEVLAELNYPVQSWELDENRNIAVSGGVTTFD
jgi:hypothetical protein